MTNAASPMIGFMAGSLALMAANSGAQAACPIQLAVYGEAQSGAEIDFTPAGTSATVTNTFRMILDNNVVLDGIAMWTEGSAARPHGSLMYKCPTGDVTGEELAACTVWEGVIYSADDKGSIGLLPAEGADAPQSLILPDLGPSLEMSAAYGPAGFSKVPWDIFVLKGCQE
ncbi:hypothetical protein RFM68_22945 [Mesorhizobium sp. MSK_1335]|uniref:Spore coat protein U domain-containing protein n=1 Tax=Mesorhizobium montanum TaxID=3072323 RepID=A0ABU4ZPP6_9HYPH|nr:hypothetical protein [Mesorhizobium sp. MSK_1335]MDX8527363.1 hypothetical protein [Mesorhizobium sp. MSK_1335]